MSFQPPPTAPQSETPESSATAVALTRLRSLFRLSAIPGWVVLGWEAVDHISRLNFVYAKGGLVLKAAIAFLSDHPAIRLLSGIVWLTLVVIWPRAFLNELLGRKGKPQQLNAAEPQQALIHNYVTAVDKFADTQLTVSLWRMEELNEEIRKSYIAKMNAILDRQSELTQQQKTVVQLEIANAVAADSVNSERMKNRITTLIRGLKATGEKIREATTSRAASVQWQPVLEIMERDREAIDKVVIICAIDPVDRTRQSPPYLEFKFDIFNDSLYQISIDDALAGHITFRKGNQEHKLTEYREIKGNEARNIPARTVGRFTVYQRLSTVEVESLTKTDDVWFDFSNLEINVFASDPVSRVVPRRLDTTMKLTSKTIRYLFNDERAALGQKTINASSSQILTEQPENLQTKIESLKAELAKLNGLAFEVDANVQSDASLRAHRDVAASLRQTQNRLTEVDKYLLTLQFKVQFENHDTHTRALKRMDLSLIESLNGNDNRIPFLDEPDMLQMKTDSQERDKLTRFDSTEFLPQRIETIWLHFLARISQSVGERLETLDGDFFLRLTLHALGQQPFSQDFNVDWKAAMKNATYLSLRSP